MAELLFPLQYKRQYSAPLDVDLNFQTDVEMQTYLTSPRRYAGQIVSCNEFEDSVFILNVAMDAWIKIGGGTTINSIVDKTYSELESMISLNELSPGQYYRITDYFTKYDQPVTNITMSGNIESLIILALNESTLHKQVISEQFSQDIIYYDFNDNETEVNNESRTGKILYRKDTINNLETWYDWRNVKFRRWAIDSVDWISGQNYTMNYIVKYNNVIYTRLFSGSGTTNPSIDNNNWIPILNISDYRKYLSWTDNKNDIYLGINNTNLIINPIDYNDYYTFTLVNDLDNSSGIIDGSGDGIIGAGYKDFNIGKINSVIGKYYNNIVFYLLPYDNETEKLCHTNTFKSDCYDSTIIAWYFYNNIIGNSFNNNLISRTFNNNIIKDSFIGNIISGSFQNNNIINSNTQGNVFGTGFHNNNIDNVFNANKINVFFRNNKILKEFSSNIIDKSFEYNNINNIFNFNNIKNTFHHNNIFNVFYQNNIDGEFAYNNIKGMFSYNITRNLVNNTIELNFFYNTTDIEFRENNIYSDFGYCNIGSYFSRNIIYRIFVYVTVGTNFNNNITRGIDSCTFGNSSGNNTFNGYCTGIYIPDNFVNNKLEALEQVQFNTNCKFNNITIPLEYLDLTNIIQLYQNYNTEVLKKSDGTIVLSYTDNLNNTIYVDIV